MGTPREQEGPLVGDGGSTDETGWEEQPTRPDRPSRPPAKEGVAGQRKPASVEDDDDLDEKER